MSYVIEKTDFPCRTPPTMILSESTDFPLFAAAHFKLTLGVGFSLMALLTRGHRSCRPVGDL